MDEWIDGLFYCGLRVDGLMWVAMAWVGVLLFANLLNLNHQIHTPSVLDS